MNSCLIIAGEKSGEEHAMSFLPRLRKLNPHISFFGVGGDELAQEGMELLFHLNDFSSWGFSEVIAKIPFYKKALDQIVLEVEKRNCKVCVLIDFQDFNLRLAQRLNAKGVKVLYYVAPQAWAWKAYRAKVLEKTVHTLFTIIPFEKNWFQSRGVRKVVSIDHPILTRYQEMLEQFCRKSRVDDFKGEVKILLLPGSRNFEVDLLLPEFVQAIKDIRQNFKVRVGIVKSSSVKPEIYQSYDELFDEQFVNEQLVEALKSYDMALAASGTVTLACALFSLPTVVAYKGSLLNEWIYQTFISYDGHVSLANIVHNQCVFPEYVQERATSFNLVSQMSKWLYNQELYNQLVSQLNETKNIVKGDGVDVADYINQIFLK